MATTSDVERLKSGRLRYRGQTFPDYNKQVRTSGESKKFKVLAKKGDQVKVVRYGDSNMEIKRDNPERKRNFRARHNCDCGSEEKRRFRGLLLVV
jgi:hypothetical protein